MMTDEERDKYKAEVQSALKEVADKFGIINFIFAGQVPTDRRDFFLAQAMDDISLLWLTNMISREGSARILKKHMHPPEAPEAPEAPEK